MRKTVIIKKAIITEKSLRDAVSGIFTFEVDLSANKFEIKKAIEEMFKVHVKRISTTIIKGKKRLVGKRRVKVQESDRKRAKVRLAKDEKIDLFEVTQTK